MVPDIAYIQKKKKNPVDRYTYVYIDRYVDREINRCIYITYINRWIDNQIDCCYMYIVVGSRYCLYRYTEEKKILLIDISMYIDRYVDRDIHRCIYIINRNRWIEILLIDIRMYM